MRVACSRSPGFPYERPSTTTVVSTPRTRSPCTARALRSAFSITSPRGSPSSVSSTSGTTTSKRTPSCWRIARRCGERDASISMEPAARGPRPAASQLGEEDLRLALGGVRGVRPVNEIGLDLEAVVAADRSRRRLDRVGGADHLAGRLHGLVTLEHHRHERAAGDELHQLAEERLVLVLGVMLLRLVARDGHVLERGDPQALALEAGDDLAGERALEGVGLDE